MNSFKLSQVVKKNAVFNSVFAFFSSVVLTMQLKKVFNKAEYHKARKLLKEYNNLDSELIQEREQLLNELFNFKGSKVQAFG